jgi:hypothetical protein
METVDASLFLDARLQVLGAAVAERGLAENYERRGSRCKQART